MQRPIPLAVRSKLDKDPFMHKCCLSDGSCEGRIEWDHHLKYGGRRQDEWFGILPLCQSHHRREAQFRREKDIIMVRRASEEDLLPYCKVENYIALKRKHA